MDIITNPISSNSVTEVGIPKPKCFTDCGNSLNDWLKWLAYDKCVTDWSTVDTQCLREYLGDTDTSDQDLEKIISLLIEATCAIMDSEIVDCCSATSVNLTIDPAWTTSSVNRATKKNGIIYVEGLITGSNGFVTTLPIGFRPITTRNIPIACLDNTTQAYVTVESNGDITVVATGIELDLSLDFNFKI